MDDRLQKALNFSNFMVTFNNQRRLLQENFKEKTTYYYNGGEFTIDRSLLSYCKHQSGKIVLIDNNLTPIEIEDISLFYTDCCNIYEKEVANYAEKYSDLIKTRNVEALISND